MENWYQQSKKIISLANVKTNDLPFVQAQILLAEIMKKMPSSHPLKGKAYYAGGSVRDEILGQIPKDLDIVVEYPQGGILFAQYLSKLLGLREPVIYPTFGTAQLKLKDLSFDNKIYDVDGVELEFVQTRKEQYHEESRKPETSFGTLAEDVERRDFTVNSLLKKLESGPSLSVEEAQQKVDNGDILDLTGKGILDMKSGIIRTPLAPDVIFSEDPLRMLRAVRFSVKYGWKMTPEVIEGIKSNLHRLPAVSNERIRDELDKIVKYGKMHKAIPLMREVGLLQKVMPEMDSLIGVDQDAVWHSEGDAYTHTLNVIEALEKNNPGASPYLVWAAIAHDWGKLAAQSKEGGRVHFYGHENISAELVEQRMRELKYPNDVIKKTVKLVSNHMRGHTADQWSEKAYRKFHREMGSELDDVLALLQADEEGSKPESGEQSKNYQMIKEKMPQMMVDKVPLKPVLDGNAIISMVREKVPAFRPGPAISEIMAIQMDILMENPMLASDAVSAKQNIRQALEADPRYIQIIQELH